MKQSRSADRRKHHIIYKTTCLITGRYYVGMHSTDDLADGYLGSGKRLWQSIKKHGEAQHRREVIEHLPSREALRLREAQLVDEQLLQDPLCMNLALGGGHGWEQYNTSPNFKSPFTREVALKGSKLGTAELKRKWLDPQFAVEQSAKIKKGLAKSQYDHGSSFRGKTHTAETRLKMSNAGKHRIGVANPQHGTRWITNGIENAKTRLAELPLGWRFGRTMGP